jgi:hypothetical protein
MTRLALLAFLALPVLAAGPAAASNTATSRSFTSEWQCENGRTLLVNAHPTRPREEAWLTYAGKRVEVVLQPTTKDAPQRFASKDGTVVWARLNDTSMLQFAGLTEQPLACSLKSTTQPRQ